MEIRVATVDDADTLAALNACVQAIHVHHHPGGFRSPEPGDVAEWFRARLVEPGVRAWLVVRSALPVAYALVIPRERLPTPFTVAERYFEIDQLAVLPELRRQGIARALVTHIRAETARGGSSALRLQTWMFNADARSAFERLGFRPEVLRYRLDA